MFYIKDLDNMEEALSSMTLKELLEDCSSYQQTLFPEPTTATSQKLLHAIAMQANTFDIIDKCNDYLSSIRHIPTVDPIAVHDFVLRCLVRNSRMQTADLRELLLLWEPYVHGTLLNSYNNTACAEAIYQRVSKIIACPIAVEDADDVALLQEHIDGLIVLRSFENKYLYTRVYTPVPSQSIEKFIVQAKQYLASAMT